MVTTQLTNDQAAAAVQMMRVVAYAETIGLVSASMEAGVDLDDFHDAVDALAAHGLARRVAPSRSPSDLERVARATMASIEESPIPSAEWSLAELLGDRLATLVGISVTSMGRYRAGSRVTPDDVAARLHLVAQIVSDLSGSYNDYGVRRWFDRPRQVLGGRAPRDILTGAWDPDSPAVAQVRQLAAALVG